MNTAEEEPWKEEKEGPSEKGCGVESSKGSSTEEDELTQRIVDMVEYYFSDERILRDGFLLKRVRQNREGYVSLKLMTSFRRVRGLTKNWEVVRDALQSSSSKLEVNAEGTKVRRRDPLPEHDETAHSRTVICFPLAEHATVKAVARVFLRCGTISMIAMLSPGGPMLPCAKCFLRRHPEVKECLAAVVEFDHREAASLAVREASPQLHVMSLQLPP